MLEHGRQIELDPSRNELRIGRDGPPTTDVQLPFASVSRVHAWLTRHGRALEVTDQGSKNGSGPAAYLRNWNDYIRSETFPVDVGHRFRLGSVGLLALDEQTSLLAEPLTAYGGPGADADVDRALAAVIWRNMIILCGSSGDDRFDLARTLHDRSIHRDYPFTRLDALPRSAAAIDDLCTRAGCGTIVLDMTKPFCVPARFARNLFSSHFHLWTVVVARRLGDVFKCFGDAWHARPFDFDHCAIGFPKIGRHLDLSRVSFSATGESHDVKRIVR